MKTAKIGIQSGRFVQITRRSEFGFERTECACRECQENCRHIPGYLIPDDIERIGRHLGYTDMAEFADHCLLASQGATVMRSDGRLFQIPTIVPRRKEDDNSCVFLEGGHCSIHPVSPFGCAYFDCGQSHEEANRRSGHGLQEIARHFAAAEATSAYAVLWCLLYAAGRRAIPPHIARRQMQTGA